MKVAPIHFVVVVDSTDYCLKVVPTRFDYLWVDPTRFDYLWVVPTRFDCYFAGSTGYFGLC